MERTAQTPAHLTAEMEKSLQSIRIIMDSKHPTADPIEKLIRIGWVIGALPSELRDPILYEVQNRVMIGRAANISPTDIR